VHALATGHLATAAHDNVLLVLAVPVVLLLWAGWMARSLARPARPRTGRLPGWWVKALVVGMVAFAVARNVGVAPFTLLAPLS
jgi:hypothetical protein